MKQPRSYLVLAALGCGVLFFAYDLSRGDRGPVDWVVLGLVSGAILWNLIQLGRRLHRGGGGKDLWHLQRTLLFWVIGWLNTALVRPADVGSWKNVLGWVFLGLAAMDSFLLYRKERAFHEEVASAGSPGQGVAG